MQIMLSNVAEKVWRTLVQVYVEFSLESSVNGLKYTTQAKTTVGRLFWVVVIVLSLLSAVKLAGLFYERHESGSMSTVIISNQFPTAQLPLPAVTLCHGNIAVMHKVLPYLTSQKRIYMPRGLTRADFENSVKYLREAVHPSNHFPEELDKLQQILSANRLSLLELFENISPNCSEFLLMCQFEGETEPCDELTEPVVTPYGICCSFNYENPQDNAPKPNGRRRVRTTSSFGGRAILSFLARSLPSHERVASIMHGDGVKVMIHERHAYPGPAATEIVAPAGHETMTRLRVNRVVSSKEILGLSDAARGCHHSPESSSRPYRADNCQVGCQEAVIRELCGCVPFYASAFEIGDQVCNLTHVSCLSRTVQQTHSLLANDFRCDCLPDCEETTYKATVTTLPLVAAKYRAGSLYRKAEEHPNATLLHVSFASITGTLQRRELIVPKINLVSSLGGLFGLFLGCSFITVVEFVYFFFIHFANRLRSNMNPREANILDGL